MTPSELEDFQNWKVPLPSREAHGTETEIQSNLQRAEPTNWRLEGNQLIADTPMGTLVNHIPTDYILVGTDKKGLPILKKL